MTKERLEELIKQKGKVYTIVSGVAIEEIELDEAFIGYNIKQEPFLRSKDCSSIFIERLFETKEQAEWHLKNDAERTERFEPPMWEDIDGYCFNFVVDNINYRLCVEKENLITVGNGIWNNLFEKYASDVTKENYEKACEIVRDLFKGESNGKNA